MAIAISLTKLGGRISDWNGVLEHLTNAVFSMRNGRYVIRIERDVQRRTVDQNALMWLWFTCIADETGTSKQDVHDYYCACFLSRQVLFKDAPQTVSGSTSRLNTASMSRFLDQVQADAAAEFGIRLPHPDDNGWLDFYERYKHLI